VRTRLAYWVFFALVFACVACEGESQQSTYTLQDALHDGDFERAQDGIAEVGSLNEQQIGAVQTLGIPECIQPQF
jgi:hypothetical protein